MVRSAALLSAGFCLVAAQPIPESAAAEPAITYHVETWLGDAHALHARFGASEIALLEKLNRRDLKHLQRYTGPIVSVEPSDVDELAVSPLPQRWQWANPFPKALVVHQPWQAFGAYEHGELVRWGPVSTGRQETRTPPGLYHLNWRSRGRHSTVDPSWFMTWYFNFDNRRGLSMHAYALPGYPASHACVRLLERDAQWVFAWGEGWQLDATRTRVVQNGTPLWVIGSYDFSAPPPWLQEERLGEVLDLPGPDEAGAM